MWPVHWCSWAKGWGWGFPLLGLFPSCVMLWQRGGRGDYEEGGSGDGFSCWLPLIVKDSDISEINLALSFQTEQSSNQPWPGKQVALLLWDKLCGKPAEASSCSPPLTILSSSLGREGQRPSLLTGPHYLHHKALPFQSSLPTPAPLVLSSGIMSHPDSS